MAASGIHGKFVEITVVGCSKLKDTEWFCRQDPYVCLEYGTAKFRTRTCTDGGRKAAFQEKFVLTLIEGLREVKVSVFNENTITIDDFIGGGKAQLHKVLSTGFDDSSWPLQSESGRFAGEVRLIMHYSFANRPAATHAPPYGTVPPLGVVPLPPVSPYGAAPQVQPYGVAPLAFPQNSPCRYAPPSQTTYAPPLPRPQARQSPTPFRPQQPQAFPSPPPPLPPPSQGVYPQSPYTPPPPSNYTPPSYPPQSSDYPPSSYPPPLHYPPPSSTYPDPYSTYPDPSPYSHSSRDMETEPQSTHFGDNYHYDEEY